MIAIIRICGQINIDAQIKDTLDKLKIRRKYACIVLNEKPEMMGMIRKVENFTAFGKINKETLAQLIEKRGQLVDKKKKINAEKIADEILNSKKDIKFDDLNLKPFFRLHPPRGGMKSSKKHFPKGILGNHGDKINELIVRML